MYPYVEKGVLMASVVAEFFMITGLDMVPPENLAELIPYLLHVVVGVALVSGVFAVIGKVAEVFVNFRRF